MTTERRTLRVITCGSSGDGTTTLIERLLRTSGTASDDRMDAPEDACGTGYFTLLADALQAGQEPGDPTATVCRTFTTDRRRILVTETPGHGQITRSTAAAAAAADIAVILVDAGRGLLPRTRLQSRIAAMTGVRHAVLAINKMDLVEFNRSVFDAIAADFQRFAGPAGFLSVQAIPLCALEGDNVSGPGSRTPWYMGPDLMTYLDTVETDAGRGDEAVSADDPPRTADQFEARLFWMSGNPLVAGRPYLLRLHCTEVTASVSAIKYREDVDNGAHLATRSLGPDEIGVVNVSLGQAVAFKPYAVNRALGGFLLIDRLTLETAGAGMIGFALRRASNIHWQALEVDRAARAQMKGQTPCCIWFTGLSGSGKSTIANLLEKRLHSEGRHTYLLDGDNVRHGLNRDLGFTEADRVENIRRIAEVARLMVDSGLIVLVSFISPFRSERQMARELFAEGEFIEVFVDTPLEECERRDPKGLYAKARRGELKNFTGIDSAYEPPVRAEVRLQSGEEPPEISMERVVSFLTGSRHTGPAAGPAVSMETAPREEAN